MKTWMWVALGGVAFLWWYSKNGKTLMLPPQDKPNRPVTPEDPQFGYTADGQQFVMLPDSSQDGWATTGQENFTDPGAALAEMLWGYSITPRANQINYKGGH